MSEIASLSEALNGSPPKRKVGRPRKPKNPAEIRYMLENIPKDLWLEARAEATRQQRPIKAILLELIRTWVEMMREARAGDR